MQSKQSTSQPTPARAAENVRKLIDQSQNILVLCSRPSDIDSYGTGAALGWYLEQLGKTPTVATRFKIEAREQKHACVGGIVELHDLTQEEFHKKVLSFDLVISVDSSSWHMVLGENYEYLLEQLLRKQSIAHIDHHQPGNIVDTIPKYCVHKLSSCTAYVLYEFFIKPSQYKPPATVAQWLYEALITDTGRYKYNINAKTMRFAGELIDLGADHDAAVNTDTMLDELKFLSWGIQHTEFVPELRCSFLIADERKSPELVKNIGDDWDEYMTMYKSFVMRTVEGYDYGIIISYRDDETNTDKTYKVSWRTRNYGPTVEMKEVFIAAGLDAGGHRNAGGATYEGDVDELVRRLKEELRVALQRF